tara:strand:- start:1332 stop:2063 length:732 start_codon:yes stop_codon:yes gene_type:complete
MIICTVLTGTKYTYEDVNKLYRGLKNNTTIDFDFLCYTDHIYFHKLRAGGDFEPGIIFKPLEENGKKLQWYKLDFFKKDFVDHEDIIVMDIDLDIVGNVDFLFDDYKGFVGSHRWWWRWREDKATNPFALSGTVYKFKNGEHQIVVDTFEKDIKHWEEYFIKNGTTKGPVNGEQHFVQKVLVDNNIPCSYFPEKHIIKWHKDDFTTQLKLEKDYQKWSGNLYIDYMDEEDWHPDIRIIHYAGS